MPDINIHDSVATTELVNIYKMDDFSDFARGYSYFTEVLTGLEDIEFENGVSQTLDLWGRDKMVFEINFPVSKLSEALPIREYYRARRGQRFYFTCPLDGITYTVKFRDKSYKLERRHFTTYFASVVLIEDF